MISVLKSNLLNSSLRPVDSFECIHVSAANVDSTELKSVKIGQKRSIPLADTYAFLHK